MVKTTVYLPEELDARLAAEASAIGVSKAELIRKGIAMALEDNSGPRHPRALPQFDSGQSRTSDEMDEAIQAHIAESAARR